MMGLFKRKGEGRHEENFDAGSGAVPAGEFGRL